MKVLWILNKYVLANEFEKYYFDFLHFTKNEMLKKGIKVEFLSFSDNLKNTLYNEEIQFFINKKIEYDIVETALSLENKYSFTFKGANFADLLQSIDKLREINVSEKEFNELNQLVSKFIFLEQFIIDNKFNFIFSDVSPEVEMEFARYIGIYHNITVLKDYEGPFLGNSVFVKLGKFGKEQLVEANIGTSISKEQASKFIEEFITNRKKPYEYKRSTVDNQKHKSFFIEFINLIKIKRNNKFYIQLKYKILKIFYIIEHDFIKKLFLDKFEKNNRYFFLGLHLNQESTMAYRAQPYTNQVMLAEMISRVLPANHYLYVREHPHWQYTYKLSYLLKFKKLNNVKLISNKISIHDILKNSKGLITYNSTTGLESLIYGKPVLSFSSNLYYNLHPAVDYCSDLYTLNEKLIKLSERKVLKSDTINYLIRLSNCSHNIYLSSYMFYSFDDAKIKAKEFSNNFAKVLNLLNDNK